MNTAKPEKSDQPEKKETLAERSARLEAEAAGLYEEKKQEDPHVQEPAEINVEPQAQPSGAYDQKLKTLQNELDTAKDQAMRALAEAENTRRRAQKDREESSKYAISSFAKDLLNVADNLRRALEAVPTDLLESEPRLKNLVEGVDATERDLLSTFEKHGVKKLEPLDEPFDPNFHEVMFEAPAPGKPAGTIMQIMEAGYTLHDRLLRPARVGVSKDDENTPPAGENAPGGHIDTQA